MNVAAILLILCLPSAMLAAEPATGGVTGKVPLPARTNSRIAVEKYTGSISGKVGSPPLPKAGVWIEGPGLTPSATPPPIQLSQKDYQFATSMLVVPCGATVIFPNEDPDYHNIFSLSKTKRFDVGRYKTNERPPPRVTFERAGFVRLQCEIHEHMKAAVLVVNSRYFTVTDETGRFTLRGLPPGTYELHAQFDESSKWNMPVTISAGRITEVNLTAPAQ